MFGIVWVAGVSLLACTVLGVVTLAALPPWLRRVLVPASPAVGVVTLVLAMTWLQLAVTGRTAATVVWVAAAIAVLALVVRGRHRLPTGHQLRALVVVLGVGIVLALPALAPSLRAGTSWVVEPSSNNDAVWHVGMAEWFLDHRAGERPDVDMAGAGEQGPFIWPTVLAIDTGMRRGEPLVQGALSVLTTERPMAQWSPLTAMWVALLPGALLAGLRLLGASRAAAAAGALVGASSAVMATQVFWQHGPSVLAMCAPLPLALGLTWSAPRHRAAAVAAGVAWAAVATLYNELLPLYLPVAVVLLGLRILLGARRRRMVVPLAMGGAAVVVAALPTLLRMFTYLRDLVDQPTMGSSPYVGAGRLVGVLRMVGLLPVSTLSPSCGVQLALALVVAVVVVAAAAVTVPSLRGRRALPLRVATVVLGLSVLGALAVAQQRDETYSGKRVVDTGVPIVLALGAATVAAGVQRQRATRWVPILGLGALGLVVVANAASGWRTGDIPDLDARTVDADLRAVADVVRAHSPEGDGVEVALGSYFDEHWLGLMLVDRPGVAYPLIGAGYVPGIRYGQVDDVDLVVVDQEVAAALGEAPRTGRFALADVAGRSWSVVQFGPGWYEPEIGPEGPARWMSTDGAIVVTGRDLQCATALTMSALRPTTVTRRMPNVADAASAVDAPGTVVDLQLPGVPLVDATLHADPPAAVGVEGDGRALSVEVTGAVAPSCTP